MTNRVQGEIYYPFATAKERLEKETKRSEPLIGGLVFRKTLCVLGAPEDSFKTNWALQLAICLSLGIPCYSFSCKKSEVAYLVIEGGEDYILERLEDKIDALGVNRDEVLSKIRVQDFSGVSLDDEEVAKNIEQSLLSLKPKPDVVFFDPITYALAEDVRYSPEKTKLCRNAVMIAREVNGVVFLITHTRKGAKDNDDMDDFLGSGQIARAAATRIKLYRSDGRVNMYAKTRYAERPDKISLKWHFPLLKVEPVELKPREEAKLCVIETLNTTPDKSLSLGDLVETIATTTGHNRKTVRAAINNLEVENSVTVERIPKSAKKLVKLASPYE